MAWTAKQKKEHSKRMKARWAEKRMGAGIASAREALPQLLQVTDNVNHPSHYTSHPSGIECIEITQHHNFCIGNAIKYLWRAGQKGDYIEDLEKAKWYIEQEIERANADS